MKLIKKKSSIIFTIMTTAIFFVTICYADNPIIQTKYTADPAPMVYHDTVYLYTSHDEDNAFGNGPCYYAKLNEDMISLGGDIQVASIDFTGTPNEASFTEGLWLWKKNNHYYLAWASRCCPEGIGYAMSNSPTGSWKCKGTIMDPDSRSSGNHPGIIEYKGNSYVFGFNYAILKQTMSKHNERRSICVERMTYNEDGTIQKVPWWSSVGAMQIGTLNPYIKNEAETIAYSEGLKTEFATEWERNIPWDKGRKIADRLFVTNIHNGDYIKVKGVDFSQGVSLVEVSAASLYGGKIEIHSDKIDGQILGTVNVNTSGEGDIWRIISTPINNIKGVHDLFFVFKGEKDLFNFDWWKFIK